MGFNPDKNKPGPDAGYNDYNNSLDAHLKKNLPTIKGKYNPLLDDGNFDQNQKLLPAEIDDVTSIPGRGDGSKKDTTSPAFPK